MKKSLKSILAILLTLIMVIGIVPFASAGEATDNMVESIKAEDLISFTDFAKEFYAEQNPAVAVIATPFLPMIYAMATVIGYIFAVSIGAVITAPIDAMIEGAKNG